MAADASRGAGWLCEHPRYYPGICLPGTMGTETRNVLQKLTMDDISNEALPYLHARMIHINGIAIWAQRFSYVGELGWELYIPNERGELVWDAILNAGAEFEIEVGGYKVLDSLRLEKGYRYYTADVTQLKSPYEAGLGFCVDLAKEDFIGKAALTTQKESGLTRKLCTVVLDEAAYTQIYGGESVYYQGKVIARVRSGGYGFTVQKNILYTYLPIELAKTGTRP